ncbi:hypothetical protein DH2020_028645 [Rehmannia glutinosa]|uniref:Uncharacterized protein n=1 Tax=Rehmannia glutinosa TaxID=99300 RepID=A0ABR0VRS9_REHGL
MKSLVFHGNGCTIFNSEADVVYRVDNYQQRCSSKVFLMDSSGKVLYSINKRIIGLEGKSALKIIDFSGQLLAEAVQKQSSEGVPLGEDVLSLMVEPQADQSLVMALVTVYGLINNKL